MKNLLPFYQHFYTEELYLVQEKSAPEPKVEDAPVSYNKDNFEEEKKELQIVVDDIGLKSNHTLSKLLAAIKHPAPDFSTSKESGYNKCLVFGGIGDKSKYEPMDEDGVLTLYSDSLETLEANKPLKHQLWAALQKMFL